MSSCHRGDADEENRVALFGTASLGSVRGESGSCGLAAKHRPDTGIHRVTSAEEGGYGKSVEGLTQPGRRWRGETTWMVATHWAQFH